MNMIIVMNKVIWLAIGPYASVLNLYCVSREIDLTAKCDKRYVTYPVILAYFLIYCS